MDNGWVVIHRKIQDWEWYQNPKMVLLFLHLLTSANHEKGQWQGHTIEKGQLITGRLKLKEKTGLSEQSIKTCLTKLKSTNEITIKSTSKFSLITIVKWDDYQVKKKHLTSKLTSKLTNQQPTTNQQLTTNNNDNNEEQRIRKEGISPSKFFENKEQQLEVLNWLISKGYSEGTIKLEIQKFINYWNELDNLGKPRWKKQPTFQIRNRFITWFSRIKQN